MSDSPNKFTANYYDRDYFATPKGKRFKKANGSTEHWGYKNPTGDWTGAKPIALAWKKIFNPRNILDVGAGRGTFIAYARECGMIAEGFDFSQWAVGAGRFKRCRREWLRHHDATERWPYRNRSYDLVVALDFMEHIYLTDLPKVERELFRVAGKWMFLQIATVDGVKETGYALKKGEPIPLDTDGRTWAGHVTVQTEQWWLDRLESEEWLFRRDMVNWFCSLVDPAIIANWLKNTIIVLERI